METSPSKVVLGLARRPCMSWSVVLCLASLLVAGGLAVTTQTPQAPASLYDSLRQPGLTLEQTQDLLLKNSKATLADFLHYKGLEDPPAEVVSLDSVPEYTRHAFNALDSVPFSSWDHSMRELPSNNDAQTIWGIKLENVTRKRRNVQLVFTIQPEVLRVKIDRVELVYPQGLSLLRSYSTLRLQNTSMSICVGHKHPQCARQRYPLQETMHIEGRFYVVHDLTSLFKDTLDYVSDENSMFAVYINTPRIGNRAMGWDDHSLFGRNGPVMVLYSNLPNVLSEEYRIPVYQMHGVRHMDRHPNRLKRSLDDTRAAVGDEWAGEGDTGERTGGGGVVAESREGRTGDDSVATQEGGDSTDKLSDEGDINAPDDGVQNERPDNVQMTPKEDESNDDVKPTPITIQENQGLPGSASMSHTPAYCSLVGWYVDFSVIGWDSFILTPRGYWGNMCHGPCDIPLLSGQMVNISHHAFVKNLFRMDMAYGGRPDLAPYMPTISCTPIRIDPISVIVHSGRNTLIKRRMQDMAVSRCGCI